MNKIPSLFRNSKLYRAAARAGGRVSAVKQRLLRVFIVVLIVRTIQEMSEDDASHMAAGVAYYAIFSLFPLLLGLIAIFSFFLESGDVQSRVTEFATEFLPGSEQFVESNIDAVFALRGALGIFAILGLFWSGSAVFGAVTRAVNRAWDVHKDRPIYVSKPRQLAMALGVGLLFWMSISVATFSNFAAELADVDAPVMGFLVANVGRAILQGTSLVMTIGIFLLLYKFLPNTRTYWRFVWPGAVVAGVLFEVSKNLFITYLNQFANFDNVYGSVAPVIVLLFWTYVSGLILILGAELSAEYGRLKMGLDRGVLLIHARKPDEDEDDEPYG